MPSIFSIGRTLSRTIPSMRSRSLPRKRPFRAASESRFLRLHSVAWRPWRLPRNAAAAATALIFSASASACAAILVGVGEACWPPPFPRPLCLSDGAPPARCRAPRRSDRSSFCVRNFSFADGKNLFLRLDGFRSGRLGRRSRRRTFRRLLGDFDRALHLGNLDGFIPLNLKFAKVAISWLTAPRSNPRSSRSAPARSPRPKRFRLPRMPVAWQSARHQASARAPIEPDRGHGPARCGRFRLLDWRRSPDVSCLLRRC